MGTLRTMFQSRPYLLIDVTSTVGGPYIARADDDVPSGSVNTLCLSPTRRAVGQWSGTPARQRRQHISGLVEEKLHGTV